MGGENWLYAYEIESLWYHYYDPHSGLEIDVYPWDMILHVTVCYGLCGDEGPAMAIAFVDEGYAAAFVGAYVSIPALHNDDFTEAFWNDLCQSDETVYDSTISYISVHNQYDDYGGDLNVDWEYGTDIGIYGDTNAVLDN